MLRVEVHLALGGLRAWRSGPAARAAVLLAVLLAAPACAGHARFFQAKPNEAGEVTVQLDHAGLSRVLVNREATDRSWKTVMLRNAGPLPVRGLRLWDLSRLDLFQATGDKTATAAFNPFALLPGEQFACSSVDQGLGGLFLWELPRDEDARQACLRLRHAALDASGVTLEPTVQESWIQLHFESPLPHTSARLALQAAGGRTPGQAVVPQVWINLDGRVWARVATPQPQADWDHPFDLTSAVAGHRRFNVRITCSGLSSEPGSDDDEEARTEAVRAMRAAESRVQNMGGEQNPAASAKPSLTRLRVEREVEGPGALRAWRAGVNEISVSLKAPEAPQLELKLMGER